MTNDFTENFVHLCRPGFASDKIAELRFYHLNGTFCIASLVIMFQELIVFQHEQIIHLVANNIIHIQRKMLINGLKNSVMLNNVIDLKKSTDEKN
jgi:hypothetical protein